jgi:hypothetical protein
MSSAVVSTSAALGRPFVFDDKEVPDASLPFAPAEARPPRRSGLSGDLASADPRLAHITQASRLGIRPAPEMVSSGIPAINALTGGLPRGCLTEICGPASSGRTTLLLAALAATTRRGEFCAVVDASDTLDPQSAAAAGVELERLLWVRCGAIPPQKDNSPRRHRNTEGNLFDVNPEGPIQSRRTNQSEHCLEQVLRATDLLLESGGFGLIVLDLGDLPPQAARRVPLTTWFRFRRAVEHTPTILLTIEQQPIAGSCSSLLLQLGSPGIKPKESAQNSLFDFFDVGESAAERRKNAAHGASRGSAAGDMEAPEGRKKIRIGEPTGDPQNVTPTHAQLLIGLDITAELICSRLERKPTRSAAAFASKTAWAG